MDNKLHRILYATDLSPAFMDGITNAVQYAVRHKAKLIIFHVIRRHSIDRSQIRAAFFNEDRKHNSFQEKSNTALQQMKNLLEVAGETKFRDHPEYLRQVEYLVVHHGKIAEQIVEKANRWKSELIILGPRRRGLFRKILGSSISRRVKHRTDIPVQVIEIQRKKAMVLITKNIPFRNMDN